MVDIMVEDKARASGQVLLAGPERRRKNLIRLGVDQDHAYAWSRTRKAEWGVAQSPILIITISLSRLRRNGYESAYLFPQNATYNPVNRRIRDPYVWWCLRRSPSEESGGAVYTIVCPCFLFRSVLGQPYPLAIFGLRVGFERLANVYGYQAVDSFTDFF